MWFTINFFRTGCLGRSVVVPLLFTLLSYLFLKPLYILSSIPHPNQLRTKKLLSLCVDLQILKLCQYLLQNPRHVITLFILVLSFWVSNLLIKASKWTCDIENYNNCCHPKYKIGIFVWKIYFLPFVWIFLMIWKVFELNEWIQTLNLWHWSWLGFFLVCGVFLIG